MGENSEPGRRIPKRQGKTGDLARALVVDDEPELARLVRRTFEKLGLEVVECESGDEAWDLLQSRPNAFSLVLTDQLMPGELTGLDLTERIRCELRDLPVILCTGFSEGLDEATALRAGVDAFLLKPVSLRRLRETVRELLGSTGEAAGGDA